ncbi:hypothetical protein K488DRAFT_90815 [Vararia minispora EC-137]|uniref:Uncharacterized protein n=1 Tax=Vararia minispora EC-137 TaxID=1314806 RepID=A0ACB8Q6S6_9AGAM|nr:hypothetical protein K488DRAFT_90815 [Vararia minispora EC-137]
MPALILLIPPPREPQARALYYRVKQDAHRIYRNPGFRQGYPDCATVRRGLQYRLSARTSARNLGRYFERVTYTDDASGIERLSFHYVSLALSTGQMEDIRAWAALSRVNAVAHRPVGRRGGNPVRSATWTTNGALLSRGHGLAGSASSPIELSPSPPPPSSIQYCISPSSSPPLASSLLPPSSSPPRSSPPPLPSPASRATPQGLRESPDIQVFSGAYHKPSPDIEVLSGAYKRETQGHATGAGSFFPSGAVCITLCFGAQPPTAK